MNNRIYLFTLLLFLALVGSCSTKSSEQSAEAEPEVERINSQTNEVASFDEWLINPVPLVSAHRGGPYPGFPENAIETFQNVIDQTPAVIECDIAMTSDGVLVLMHDNTLDRTTDGTGNVWDKSYDELQELFLVDNDGIQTSFRIPTLDETLAWGKGNALFTLDVKRGVPFEKVLDAVREHDAESYAAIITYRIQDAKLVHSLNENVMISVSAGDQGALDQLDKSGIPTSRMLGFVGVSEPDAEHYQKLQERGIKTILGTLGNLDRSAVAQGNDMVYVDYVQRGASILATDRPLEAAAVIYDR